MHKKCDLSKIGFFYSGAADVVICFSCLVDFFSWDSSHSPMIAHVLKSPNCLFLKEIVREEYIREIQKNFIAKTTETNENLIEPRSDKPKDYYALHHILARDRSERMLKH